MPALAQPPEWMRKSKMFRMEEPLSNEAESLEKDTGKSLFASMDTSFKPKEPSKGLLDSVWNGMQTVGKLPGEFIKGQLKGAAKTALGIGELGTKTLGRLVGAQDIEGTSAMAQEIRETRLKPETTAEKIGMATEQIGEFFTPVPGLAAAKAAGVVKAAKVVGEAAPKIIKKGASLIAQAGFEGLEQAARVAAQTGREEKAVKEAGIVGAAIPFTTPVLKGLGFIGKNVLKTVTKGLSGVPEAAIEHAFKNPKATRTAIRAMARDPVMGNQKVVESAEDALSTLKTIRRDAYREGLARMERETMTTKGGQLYVKRPVTQVDVSAGLAPKEALGRTDTFIPTRLSTKGVKDTITKTLKDFGANVKGADINLEKVALPKSYKNELDEVVEKVYKWDDITPSGLDDLRENIDVFRKSGVMLSSAEKKFNKILGDIRENLSKYIGDRVPQIREMNREYAVHSSVIEGIMQELSLGKDKPVMALRKLSNVFNPRSEVYRPFVEELGKKAGQDLMSDIAGLTMSRWTPEGLSKYLTTMGLGAGAIGALPAAKMLLAAPLASPRIVGEAVTKLGEMAPGVKQLAEPAKTAIRGVSAQMVGEEEPEITEDVLGQ